MESTESKKTVRAARKTKICPRGLYWAVGAVLFLIVIRLVFCAFNYSVIYLQTGDIYFGKFLPFPFYVIFDAWVMQRDQIGQPYLSKVESMIWRPVWGAMKVNPRLIVFHSLLSSKSVVMKAVRNQGDEISAVPLFSPAPLTSLLPSLTE